jgi:hypothetical protein
MHNTNSLSGYLIFQNLTFACCTSRFNIQEFYILPTLYLCGLYLSQNKTAISAPIQHNWLVFITERKCVYCAVRTGSSNTAVCASSLKQLILSLFWTERLFSALGACFCKCVPNLYPFVCSWTLSFGMWRILNFSDSYINQVTRPDIQKECLNINTECESCTNNMPRCSTT